MINFVFIIAREHERILQYFVQSNEKKERFHVPHGTDEKKTIKSCASFSLDTLKYDASLRISIC
ncbi:hypothetical protein HMPREF1985_00655 [Mitsuokella sp. oral taxon 131 str. W9106]|nr:hypothetical protein HMPREF1985_00655 [Mitsuokella sp. oral taxon 131 str. W9106]